MFGLKGGVWVGSVSVIPIFPADVGYVRQSQQERDRGVEDGAGQRIVDGGGCKEESSDVTTDITFITHLIGL